jgi:branched-subunit amino acid aminotransferase/4-amino-4-deoxychorismate lyase
VTVLELYKTQVRDLARYLKIPSRIIEKPPSPDILPGITDEEAIALANSLRLVADPGMIRFALLKVSQPEC